MFRILRIVSVPVIALLLSIAVFAAPARLNAVTAGQRGYVCSYAHLGPGCSTMQRVSAQTGSPLMDVAR